MPTACTLNRRAQFRLQTGTETQANARRLTQLDQSLYRLGARLVGLLLRLVPQGFAKYMVDRLMADFAVSGATLGTLSALYFYAYAALQLPVGAMVDRWGPESRTPAR